MRKIIIIIALILSSLLTAKAQEPTAQQDTIATFKVENGDDVVLSSKGEGVLIMIAGYNISLSETKYEDPKWMLYGYCAGKIGYASLTTPDYNLYDNSEQDFLNLDGMKSHFLSLSMLIVKYKPRTNSKVTFLTGLDFSRYVFRLQGNSTLRYRDSRIEPIDTGLSLDYNSLILDYITVPLGIELKLADELYLKSCVEVGAMVANTSKYLVGSTETREYDQKGFNTFSAGLNLGIEYYGLGIFCKYNCSDIFKSNSGLKTQPFSIGISISNLVQ